MKNDVLQNYLVQFFKYLAENFDNLKFQDASKVAINRPPNRYILHYHGKLSKETIFTMVMQDVTIWWSKNCNFACILKFQVVKIFSQIFKKLN